jgi:hypothetical protein
MNSTWVVKGLFQSKSGKGRNLGTEKNKTEKKEQEKESKSDLIWGTLVFPVPALIQMTIGFGAWNEKRVSTKDVTMRGLCALCDEGWAILSSDSD